MRRYIKIGDTGRNWAGILVGANDWYNVTDWVCDLFRGRD